MLLHVIKIVSECTPRFIGYQLFLSDIPYLVPILVTLGDHFPYKLAPQIKWLDRVECSSQ
jgi:hypothetical protein